jgi:hypothetical protein
MKLEEIHSMATIDAKLDIPEIAAASMDVTSLTTKWLKLMSAERFALKQQELRLKAVIRDKKAYYSGKADAEVYETKPFNLKLLKSEIDDYVEADEDVIQAKMAIDLQREKVEFIDGFLRSLYTRSYNIRNAIDFLRFQNGLA